MNNKTDVEISPPTGSSGPTFTAGMEEFKDPNLKYNLSKFEYDLYHEEDDVSEKVIRVKRISLPNKGERWKIFENTKVLMVIEGQKLNKKERGFFQSVEGINWLLAAAKRGIKSFNSFKKDLKAEMIEINKNNTP